MSRNEMSNSYFDPRGPKHVTGTTPLNFDAVVEHDGFLPSEVGDYLYITQGDMQDARVPLWAQEYNFEMWLVSKRYMKASMSDHWDAIDRATKRLRAITPELKK